MKLTNAIKRLAKHGEVEQCGNQFWANIGNNVVQFMANGKIDESTNITCIKVRDNKDEDDYMTDYFAGVWCDNLTQAIRIATAS